MATTVIVPSGPIGCGIVTLLCVSRVSWDNGRKFSATTALGMTETMRGSRDALRTQFSLLFKLDISFFLNDVAYIPCMTDTDYMVHVAQGELEELVCKYATGICKSEETMIGEYSP